MAVRWGPPGNSGRRDDAADGGSDPKAECRQRLPRDRVVERDEKALNRRACDRRLRYNKIIVLIHNKAIGPDRGHKAGLCE